MKPLLSAIFLASLIGCATASPPTAAERALYHIDESYQTNLVGIPVLEKVGTNIVIVGTNFGYLISTNFYYGQRPAVQQAIGAGGAVATGFGAPWLLPLFGLLGALYGGYAKYRNNQTDKRAAKAEILNTVLSQSVETAREIMTLTAGPSVERKFVEKVKSEQVKADVKAEGAKVSSEKVDTGAAKEAAVDVLAAPSVVSNGQ